MIPGGYSRGRRGATLLALCVLLAACPDAGRTDAGTAAPAGGGGPRPEFNADSAHALLRRQVDFGPRVPGTEGHAAQLAWMTRFLRELADTVVLQPFQHETNDGQVLQLSNVFARFRPDARDRVLLLAHWDTRPTADGERDARRRETPIPGANDGASGTAVLLQLARIFAREQPPIGVDLLFVDGEDYGPFGDDMYLGAKYFAANLPPAYKPFYGILLDMIGDANPEFPMEGNSMQYAPEVVERVWRLAEQLGHGNIFVRRSGMSIQDDHIPLNRAGIRTIDIIDFDYGPGNAYWHTLQDDVSNTSPRGLRAVGEVLTALIYRGG